MLGGLFLIFHRPLLLGLGHRIALHYAAKENLKLEFRLEGSVFTNLIVRNLHAAPTGPSDVESIDVGLGRIDYGLFTLLRHGISTAIKSADVHSARVVMNPAKAPLRPRPPNPKKKIELPDIFPARLHISDATIIVRNRPHDFVADHVALELDPRHAGEISVEKLQLVGGQTWLKLSAPATWNGSVAAELADFHQEQTAFDRGVFQVTAKNGIATLQSADITRDKNEFHLRGSTELPRDVHDLGRAPASMELAATLPDLQQVTAGISQKLSGSAEVSGKISVKNSIVNGDLAITSPSIEFQDGRCENLNAAIKLSKKIPPSAASKPWFSDLVSQATVAISKVRFRDYIADYVEGARQAINGVVTFDRL